MATPLCGNHVVRHRGGAFPFSAGQGWTTATRSVTRAWHRPCTSVCHPPGHQQIRKHHWSCTHARRAKRGSRPFFISDGPCPHRRATLLTLKDVLEQPILTEADSGPWMGYAVGTIAAFASGWFACTWMIRLEAKQLGRFWRVLLGCGDSVVHFWINPLRCLCPSLGWCLSSWLCPVCLVVWKSRSLNPCLSIEKSSIRFPNHGKAPGHPTKRVQTTRTRKTSWSFKRIASWGSMEATNSFWAEIVFLSGWGESGS